MKKTLSFVLVLGLIFSISTSVLAYNHWPNKARLYGNVNAEKYYISHEYYNTRGYGTLIEQAVSQWNSAVDATSSDSTNVAFSRTTTRSQSVADFLIGNYGNTDWNGIATFFTAAHGQISNGAPTMIYEWTNMKLNDYELNDDTQDQIKATAKHEFGHSLGLAHADYTWAIMWGTRSSRTTYNVSSDDINGVKALY